MYKYLIGVSIVLCGAGVALAAPLGISWFEQQSAVKTSTIATVASSPPLIEGPAIIQGTPRHVTVPSVGIDVAVADGTYDSSTGAWTLSEESAFFATPTNPVNSGSGNTLLYGHDSQKIFGKLPRMQAGAEVTVTTANGYAFTYVYITSEVVSPTDVGLFAYSGKPRLTLQTCTGTWSQSRQLFYFDLKEYRKL